MALTSLRPRRYLIADALISKKNVMSAVVLRDMRTRFFNHGLGFIIVPIWPLIHMGVLILIHAAAGHGAPLYGESAALFYATGLVPTLAFMYVSRFMGWSVTQNRPMMAFPIVRSLDVMFGRAFLEFIAACITLMAIMIILWATGQNPWPFDLERAVGAYLAVIFLAFGCGILVGVLGMIQPFLLTVWQIVLICLYISSGTMFVASNLPDGISYILSFNPVLQCVEWMRTAFYASYSDKLINEEYVVSFSVVALCLGLAIERLLRRRLLEG